VSLIGRYLAVQYIRVFLLAMAAGTSLFLVIDFLQRIGNLLKYQPSATTVAAYYLFKIPATFTDVYPAAALLAVLVSVGLLVRNREVLALRACGIGPLQIAAPLVTVGVLLSLLALAWSEIVVPPTAVRYHDINDIEIKKKAARGLYNSSSLWLQALHGYANVDYYDAGAETLHGLVVYETDASFRLTRVISVPLARWVDQAWQIESGTVQDVTPGSADRTRPLRPGEFRLEATPRDFSNRRRNARDLSYRALRREVDVLRARGLEATGLEVDLQAKLAVPFSGVISVLLGLPIALRVGRRTGMAWALIAGLAAGFAYWVTMAVAMSIGRSGVLPPVAAAWLANVGFGFLAASMLASSR